MMKKLLIIGILLSLAFGASGAVLDLWITSLNGDPIPATKEIAINPSDWINIDIVLTAPVEEGTLFSLDVDMLAISSGNEVLDISELTEGDNNWGAGYTANIPVPNGWNFVRVNDTGGNAGTPALLVLDHILMHCEGPDPVIIELMENGGSGGTMMIDAGFNPTVPVEFGAPLLITQPEPMTIALLGLGGLFLRRRK
jgi:hypothetical protein